MKITECYCECGHKESEHTLTNYISTQDACSVCKEACIHFRFTLDALFLTMDKSGGGLT